MSVTTARAPRRGTCRRARSVPDISLTAVALYVLGMAVVAGLLSALLNRRWVSLLFWLLAGALMLFYWKRTRRRFSRAVL